MNVRVNGEVRQLLEPTTVAALLKQMQMGSGPVAVEVNGQVIPRAQHAQHILHEDDELEVVTFAGGG